MKMGEVVGWFGERPVHFIALVAGVTVFGCVAITSMASCAAVESKARHESNYKRSEAIFGHDR